ncbi:MAG: hypothetical protein ACP5UH_02535 [Candidatus Micrarchaeia archaeon]
MRITCSRGQSAIEFLSTYAFMLLIIAVALLLLFMYFSLPKTILPSACNFYSGFNCADAVYANTSTGSELLIVATDMMPGIVNTSAFSAYLGYVNSTSGYCAPSFAIAGQEMYCVAYFNSKAVLGRSYAGTFRMKANYCAAGASSIYNASCPESSNFTYSGYLTVSASVLPSSSVSGTYYVPITISNDQGSAVPAHFQQMIQFAPSTYVTYERTNLGNIRFYYGDKELYSWCEANCTSSSTGDAIFWVKLPVAIPPNQNMVIDMYFLPYSINYDGVYAGEAPQLSPVYGEYDNIQNVMNSGLIYQIYYDNAQWYAPAESAVYSALLNNGYAISSGGQTWVSQTNYFNTTLTGSTQDVNGGTESYVINNLQYAYSGGNGFPNPPVSNGNNAYTIKEIGFADFSSSTTFSVDIDDGGALGIGQYGGGFTSWLGGTANPSNLISHWQGEGATLYTSGAVSPGAYAIEYDWFNGGGPAYWSLWSSSPVNYYSPAFPPNGIMPSTSFGSIIAG